MIDFGKHTFHVWACYGVTVTLVAALVIQSLTQSRKAKLRLAQVEAKNG